MIEINAKAVVLPQGKYEIVDIEIFQPGVNEKRSSRVNCQHHDEGEISAISLNCRRPGKGTQTTPVSQHCLALGQFVCDLYNREQLTDVVIKVGDTYFNAHRIVLSCHSRHFGMMFMNSKKRHVNSVIELSFSLTPVCFASVLDYMYTGQMVENEFGLVELLIASIELDMNELRDVCYLHMEHFTPAQTLRLLSLADERGLKHTTLMRKQWCLVAGQFSAVAITEEFLQLSVEMLYRLLTRDDLLVRTERDVVCAAIRWIKGNEDERRHHAAKILGCVRFMNLSPGDLITLADRDDYMFIEPRIRNAILEANWYHTCKRGKDEMEGI